MLREILSNCRAALLTLFLVEERLGPEIKRLALSNVN
jgi:hypothetical protein